MSLLCVIPFYSGDLHLAQNLARHIERLGGVSNHDCLLIVDKSTTSAGVIEPLRRAFKSVTETSSEPVGDQGTWGKGTTNAEAPNEMFIAAYTYVLHKLRVRWFWLETDAVPMYPAWLDDIEADDRRGGKPFTGAYVDLPAPPPPGVKIEPHMSGIGVYPPNVPECSLDMAIPGSIAWDYAGRKDTVGKGKAHFTTLIQHEYRIHGESPTFPTQESLSVIKAGTAVFHRCKDFSLIDRLREKVSGHNRQMATIHPEGDSATEKLLRIENKLLAERVEELEAKLNCRERLAPALAAATPKKKYVMTAAHKAKLAESRQKRKTGVL